MLTFGTVQRTVPAVNKIVIRHNCSKVEYELQKSYITAMKGCFRPEFPIISLSTSFLPGHSGLLLSKYDLVIIGR